MGRRAFRAFMSLSVTTRVLWVLVVFQALGMLMGLTR
jgi:hypothetical protein